MATKGFSAKINELFEQDKWEDARALLERERKKDPNSHWVLTQLGVTFYEQRKYDEALRIFHASLEIKDDCPLTLWHLAGSLDALGKSAAAMRIYTWILESKTTPNDDPCWESKSWTDSLKTDSVYRLGVCFRHQGKKEEAERCFRQYVNLLLTGSEGTYTIEDVGAEIQKLHTKSYGEKESKKIVLATLEQSGIERSKSRRKTPPKFSEDELFGMRPVASKK